MQIFLLLVQVARPSPSAWPLVYVLPLASTLVSAPPPPSNAGAPGLQPPFTTFLLLASNVALFAPESMSMGQNI